MINFIKKFKYLALIFVLSFVIFYPSLFVFFTNDDFFFLHLSQVNSIGQFLNFFNLIHGPEGFGMYRPLTTQVFYFISSNIFHLNPIPLHIISFLFLFGIIYLIYELVLKLSKSEKMALIASFLYAVSATHFGHLYYLATFQELGMTLFVLISCLFFLRGRNLLSFTFFALALLSKETAVVTPLLIVIASLYQDHELLNKNNLKKFIWRISPFIILLFSYLLIRLFYYGFAMGDTYIWDFSLRKFVNTIAWYLLWSFNIPESLVDFVGPGLVVNPNLFVYWSKQITPILILFIVQGLLICWIIIKSFFKRNRDVMTNVNKNSLFCMLWFIFGILPVVFLPIHKFTFYLTLPLIAVVFRLTYLLTTSRVNNFFICTFLVIWAIMSFETISFTKETNWISQSELISERVFTYFNIHKKDFVDKKVVFVDTEKDKILPWSPTLTVKTALSGDNFFKVFFPNISSNISYFGKGDVTIQSRQFLGY